MFTGGEPTLHPDLASFVRHAADLGMKVMVVSNAGLWKARAIHALAEAGLSSFIISVDAATRETHEQNRGLPGAGWWITSPCPIFSAHWALTAPYFLIH